MENERNSGDVLGMVSDTMARQILCDLLNVQANRARMMLEDERRAFERRGSRLLERTLASLAVLLVLLVAWI